jgi:hypothetical protein
MTAYVAKLRYYPGDALEEIKERDLNTFARKYERCPHDGKHLR